MSAGVDAGGAPNKGGHRYVGLDGESHTIQRMVWFMHYGEWPKGRVSFKDGLTSNIAISNLTEMKQVPPHIKVANKIVYGREHRKAHPLHYRDKELKKQFGISLEKYQEMFVEQGGVCAICSQPETASRGGKDLWLAVDHDHTTNEIRGLLCSNCNRGLGCFGDNRQRLGQAAAYLQRFAATEVTNIVAFKKNNKGVA